MLRKTKNKVKTVSEKVSELISKQNGYENSDDDSAEEATAPKVIDFEDEYELPDARSTEIRKRNVKLLSEQSLRYKGKIAHRKDFELEKSSAAENEDDSSEEESVAGELRDSDDNGEEESDLGEEEESDDSGSDVEEEEEESDANEEGKTDIVAETNRQAELQKGACVQNQLRIWEKLLEMRINTQKVLSKANQLPSPIEIQEQQLENEQMKELCTEATEKTSALLKSLLELQQTLSHQFSELKGNLKSTLKRPSPYEAHSIDAPPLKRIAENLDQRFQEFKTYRNTVLLKWDDRTKLLTPGAGAKKKSLNEEYDIIRKIDNALMNRSALIEKTQTTNDSAPQAAADDGDNNQNKAAATQLNVNIYDDSDFYHQQLRELIEYKSNTSSNMNEITKQFVELQKLRQKMKKKVDTRASKGRKMRFTVHNKLINFMAPDETASSWTDESKSELFKSLFAT